MDKFREMDVLSKVIFFLMIVSLLLIGANGYRAVKRRIRNNTYRIILKGDNPIIVYQDDFYVEPGYDAYNYQNKKKNELVKTSDDIDTGRIGEYTVSYEINTFFKSNKVERKVKVVENPLKYVDFSLVGESIINLERNTKYKEMGFNVSSDKGDFRQNVSIKSDLDISKVGMYEVVYTLKIGSRERILKRLVNVIGDKYTIKLSNGAVTNQDVTIEIESNIKDFKNFINPNNVSVSDNILSFQVDKNGIYEFHMYDLNDTDELIKVNISNIDKVGPSIVCNSFVSGNKTTYNIDAYDDNGIFKYVYDGKDYHINSFVIDGIYDTSDVSVYDNAGNFTITTCISEYEYLSPNNNSYKYQYKSDTLKYWIESGNNYATTHIWVRDAYNQMKVAIPAKVGMLQTGKAIINNEIKKKNLQNKGLVSVNASGIVGGGFNEKYEKLNPSWKGTSAIPLIINDGKIIRDSTGIVVPDVSYITYAMKKDGVLAYYLFGKGDDINKNTSVKNQIINDGVRYTFGFTPVLVTDYKVRASSTENNIRQAICQIDRNNFIFVTNTNGTNERGKGFSHNSMAKYLVKLGCRIGLNLDGGGSVNHYYKGNTDTLNSIKTSSRGLVDMLYFVEK